MNYTEGFSRPKVSNLRPFFFSLTLVLMVWVVFGQTLNFDFINYDDPQYVTNNPLVLSGITWEGVVRALTHNDYSFYHPLTTISHMLDYEIYGLNPAGFHFTNVVLHTMSAVILFLVLRSMTGSLWKSFMVAAVFAIHPLRAESVAWVTERKDCLSGFFFMLTLAAYHQYVKTVEREISPQKTQNETGALSADCADGRGLEWKRKDCIAGVSPALADGGGGVAAKKRRNRKKEKKAGSFFRWSLPLKPHASCLTPSYWLVFVCMAACMFSKATVVTLPFVLLLLDYWPLGRWNVGKLECWKSGRDGGLTAKDRIERESRVSVSVACSNVWKKAPHQPTTSTQQLYFFVVEKIPFFLLSAVMAAVMVLSSGGAMHSFDHSSFLMRVSNAVISYVTYIGQLFVPIKLVVLYPFPKEAISFWKSGGSILLLGAVTLWAWRAASRSTQVSLSSKSEIGNAHSAMLTGWLWFLGMLVPMIGIVQAGAQAHADRYTYLSGIGLSVALCWGVGDWFKRRSVRKVFIGGLLGVILLTLSWCGGQQVSHWKTSIALWETVIGNSENNPLALHSMGLALVDLGAVEEGVEFYHKALVCSPNYSDVYSSLGVAYKKLRKFDLALTHYRRALLIQSSSIGLMHSIATVHEVLGENAEAEAMYRSALELEPANATIYKNLGAFLARQGRGEEAVSALKTALGLHPVMLGAYTEMTVLLVKQGRMNDAILCAQQAIDKIPENAKLHFNLGVLFEGVGEGRKAMSCYKNALHFSPNHSEAKERLRGLHDR